MVVADLDEDGAAEVAALVGGTSIRADVSKPEETVAAVRRAMDEYGRLDVVALNAGIGSGLGPLDPLDLEAYRRIVGVNQDAVVYGLDAAVPMLRASGGGKVVVTASLAGIIPMASDPLYTLTKTAVVAYVRALGPVLADHGITVTALCPGFADTAIVDPLRDTLSAAGLPLLTTDEVGDAFLAALDDGKPGRPGSCNPAGHRGRTATAASPGPA